MTEVEADGIESRLSSYIFSTLLFSLPSKCVSTLDPTSKHLNQFKKFCNNIHNCYNLIPFFCNILIKALKGPVYVQNALSQTHDGGGGAAMAARRWRRGFATATALRVRQTDRAQDILWRRLYSGNRVFQHSLS